MDKKKLPKKHIILLFCSAALLVVNLIFYSLGWFTSNKETETNGIGMMSTDSKFDLKTIGDMPGSDGIVGYTLIEKLGEKEIIVSDYGVLKSGSNCTGNEVLESGIRNHSSINWLLNNDSNFTNYIADDNQKDNYGLKPGVFGSLSFSIVPNPDNMPSTITCSITLTPIRKLLNGELDMADDKVVDFLKGHILFFQKYEGAVYTDRVLYNSNGDLEFIVDVDDEHIKSGEIPITLYWIWPTTLPELLLDSKDPNLLERQNLLPDISPTGSEEQEKNLLSNDIEEHSEYFFEFKQGQNLTSGLINSMIQKNAVYNKADYIQLCTAYNKADQIIGTQANYIVLTLSCKAD